MKLSELVEVTAEETRICLHDARIPHRFETRFWNVGELRTKRCDEMTVMLVGALMDDLNVYVELDWML